MVRRSIYATLSPHSASALLMVDPSSTLGALAGRRLAQAQLLSGTREKYTGTSRFSPSLFTKPTRWESSSSVGGVNWATRV